MSRDIDSSEHDISLLAEQILDRLSEEYASDKPELSAATLAALEAYPFPGNVRELENVLERAFTLCEGNRISPDDLQLSPASETISPAATVQAEPPPVGPTDLAPDSGESTDDAEELDTIVLPAGRSLEDYLEAVEKKLIIEALESTRWNKTAAAKKLGITFRALRYRLQKLDLE